MKTWLSKVFHIMNTDRTVKDGINTGEEARISSDTATILETSEETPAPLEETPETTNPGGSKKIFLKRNKFPKQKKPWSVRKKVIVFSCIGVTAALLIAVCVWAIAIISDPLAQFNTAVNTGAPNTQAGTTQSNGEAIPTPTINPEDLLLSEADLSILHDKFTNIMLIGVDQSEERESEDWNGKDDFHADVMIVLTINNETGEVSMISLPRDTYAKIPGVDGIYKLNASINCGGGWCDEGFKKVCQAAEWMLGGSGTSEDDAIQIDYYFAVDMNAVKGLVDEIGGVDYDLDISFTMQGRSYTKGERHMDGQAVLDYLRVRKEATGGSDGILSEDADGETGDAKRVERQKNMLVAIFKKIKENGLLFSIPSLITAFDGNLEYNMSFNQIAALAYYALNVDPETIQMYSMSGSYVTVITAESFEYPLAFTFTNQSNRVTIIKDVYDIDVRKRSSHTLNELRLLWGKLESRQYTKVAEPILETVKAKLDADALLPVEPTPTPQPTETTTPEPTESLATSEVSPDSSVLTDDAAASKLARPEVLTPTLNSTGYQQYTDEQRAFYNQVFAEYQSAVNYKEYESGEDLLALLEQLRTDTLTLCEMFGISPPDTEEWFYDFVNEYNDVYVDMR